MNAAKFTAGLLLILCAACAAPQEPSLEEALEEAGWKKEATLSGAESEISSVSPPCEQLFRLLDRSNDKDSVSGFRNEKRDSYLLIRDFPAGRNLPGAVLDAAAACPRMEMGYDSTVLVYTIKVVGEWQNETRLLLSVREGVGEKINEMLVSASTGQGENRLIRVMNPTGITGPEEDAADLAALR
ncbi:hypothetical protein [Streptomyces cavernae]|uniref:hypothetical protein n=1 Tax=Streptomyces cavernae TaxID=2259034 RepID=UPI000FEBE31A|nr:hypothetical protein [Streptomyces cavernae]